MMRTLVIFGALASPLAAQDSDLVGTWKVTFVVGNRVQEGVATTIEGTGTFTIEKQADSLVATLSTDPIPDRPARPPVRMAALAAPGGITFTAHSKATLSVNGQEREATAISIWTLKANGDALEGTVDRQIAGFGPANQGPQPVTGTRRKG